MNAISTTAQAIDPTELWDDYRPTTLLGLPALARQMRVGRVFVKNESERPLGNFKVLGGMVAGLRALARAAGATTVRDLIARRNTASSLPRLITASDGNHGLSVAAAAYRAGGKASIYLPDCVSRLRAKRIEALGAEVVWIKGTYDEAVEAAAAAAARGDGLLIPDTSPDPDDVVVHDVMAGYRLMTRELASQFEGLQNGRPTHVFVQAGVGGLAAAVALGMWDVMLQPKRMLVVEPESVACVARALEAGSPVQLRGDLHTSAEMLACGLASASAVEILRQHDARAVVVSEEELKIAVETLREAGGPSTTPSGATGLAGLMHVAENHALRATHLLAQDSTVLLIVTEGPIPQ
jgi:diaminopropionate ammonia-lyase